MRIDLQIELVLHALEHEAQVQLPEPAQHRLVGLGVVLERQARIFGRQLVQRVGQLFLVAAPCRFQLSAIRWASRAAAAQ